MRIALLALWLSLAGTATSVVIRPLSLDELIAHAEIVARGTVISKSCQRDSAGRIYTEIELDASEVWKGDAKPGLIPIVHGGGILGEERVAVSGQVQYHLGEHVVVFLVRNGRGQHITVAMAQGKFTLTKGSRGELCVSNGLQHRTAGAAADPSAAEALSLPTLKAKVTGAKL